MTSMERSSNAFQHYFGKIPKTHTDHEDPYQHETHNLPEAYLGKNRFLMSTFDYLITKEGREFLTKTILPFEHTDNLNVAWEVFHFDKTIADIEPEQGMPRYVTQKHDMYSDTLTRRGLAFIIEHGFYTTDLGKKHYRMNIQQIVDAVSDTCSYQVIRAILDCDDYYTQSNVNEPSEKIIQRELSRFGIVQRGEHGMHILDSDLKDAMNREGIRPNTYIFPARMSSYIRMRDPYMTEHSRGGVGVANLGEDPATLTFRGTQVYECRYFETDYIEEPFDPLENTIQYNEYYTLEYGETALYVYCMKQDNWVLVAGTGTASVDTTIADMTKKPKVSAKITAKITADIGGGGAGGDETTDEDGFFGDAAGFTSGMYDRLQLRRFAEKDFDTFHKKYFAELSPEVEQKVVTELRGLALANTIIRPKSLNEMIQKHGTV